MLRPLVEQAQGGDDEAFTTLAGLVGDRCLAIAYRILRDVSRAEDAVQVALSHRLARDSRTCVTLTASRPGCTGSWSTPATRRHDGPSAGWLTSRSSTSSAARPGRTTRSPSTTATSSSEAFRRLPPEQRAVFVFHHYLGLSVPEVAGRLDIPLGTAKSRLRYATTALRAALEADSRGGAAKERSA